VAQADSDLAATGASQPEWFATTHWSVVLDAGRRDGPRSAEALETLCRTYWYPLYAFVRRQGNDAAEAQDLTQGFFARLITRMELESADRARGRFRSFLLASMKHYLADEWRRAHTQKRGGQVRFVSFEGDVAERRYREEAAPDIPADRLFEQQWATTLLERTLAQLEDHYRVNGAGEVFEALKPLLVGDGPAGTYESLGARLGLSGSAVKMRVYRMRHRYQNLLRREIGHTVTSASEIDDEIRCLLRVMSDWT
jgi:RNA polymerase sigma factor (sigma-70 family)